MPADAHGRRRHAAVNADGGRRRLTIALGLIVAFMADRRRAGRDDGWIDRRALTGAGNR
jgi:hypothetical protein